MWLSLRQLLLLMIESMPFRLWQRPQYIVAVGEWQSRHTNVDFSKFSTVLPGDSTVPDSCRASTKEPSAPQSPSTPGLFGSQEQAVTSDGRHAPLLRSHHTITSRPKMLNGVKSGNKQHYHSPVQYNSTVQKCRIVARHTNECQRQLWWNGERREV